MAAEDWSAHVERERERYRDGEQRLPGEGDADTRQRALARLGNAAWGAALASLALGREAEARDWLDRAAERYLESYADAPPESWGRLIAILKARILARDEAAIAAAAGLVLAEGAAEASSPIGRYAACLALLALGRDADSRPLASSLRERDDFPHAVADALALLAAEDVVGYVDAVETVLESFEQRAGHLEEVPVADTVLVLQELARRRGFAAELSSPLLPASPGG